MTYYNESIAAKKTLVLKLRYFKEILLKMKFIDSAVQSYDLNRHTDTLPHTNRQTDRQTDLMEIIIHPQMVNILR